MNKVDVHRRILITVAGMVLLSALLLIVILPGVIQDTSPGANPKIAVIAIFVVMILHLVILYGFLNAIRANKRGRSADKGLNIGLGILLLIFGLVIMDGAFAYLDHLLFVSVLMFVSVFCDFVAALITFGTLFLKPKMKN